MASDIIGARGEATFTQLMLSFDTEAGPRFFPCFLGDKWPAVDFIVELRDRSRLTPYFFVQVKTTRAGYTKRNHRLKAQVTPEQMRRLASYPAPTYIVGIDETIPQGYIIASSAAAGSFLASIPTRYPLDRTHRALLWQEVKKYWEQAAVAPFPSRFAIPDPEESR